MIGWVALIVAVVAVALLVRVRDEVARLREELQLLRPARAAAPPPAAPKATRLSDHEFALLEQFITQLERIPRATRDRLAERLARRFAGRLPRGGGDREAFLVALYEAERGFRPERAAPLEPEPAAPPPTAPEPEPEAPKPPPAPAQERAAAAAGAGPQERTLDLETRVGTTWALRLGLGALAIAVALFARTVLPTLSAGAKVALAYAGALALFGLGRVFEARQERFARPVMAAALAIGFFVSFASHFVPAMAAVPLLPALAWMAAGVLAVLVLAERWGSEPTAGLAIFLGHVSAYVAVGAADAYSLVVIVFLSLAAVALLWRHDWLPLSLFAVVAAYASHLLWALADRPVPADERGLVLNLLFLSSYYVIFLGADLLWWRRRKRPAAVDPAGPERMLARALGPLNLVLFASVASFLYVATPDPTADIAWFFFALAALQGALTPVYRRLGNADHVFYPALAALLATIGVAAALEGLSLNLVLALEAVVLLVTAHVTRLRVFHVLAQAALAANFIHYWGTVRFEPATVPGFVGGMAVAAAYLLQASLEEVWYGDGRTRPWEATRPTAAVRRRIAILFDRGYGLIAPYLAHFHAVAGALVVVHQAEALFDRGGTLLVMGAAATVLAAVALMRRSVPLVLASATLQLLAVAVALGGLPSPWWLPGVVAVGLALPTLLATAGGRAFRDRALRLVLAVAQFNVLAMLLLPLLALEPAAAATAWPLYVAWIGVLAIACVFTDRATATFRRSPSTDPDVLAAARLAAAATGLLVIIGTLTATVRLVGPGLAAPLLTAALAATLLGAAAWRRQPSFFLAGLSLLVGGYAYWLLHHDLAAPVFDSAAATAVLAAVPLAAALLLDRFGTDSTLGRWSHWADAAIYLPYLLASGLLLAFCEARIDEGWSNVAFTALPAGLYVAERSWRASRGGVMATLLVFVALLDQLAYVAAAGPGDAGAVLAPGLLLTAIALGFERLPADRLALSEGDAATRGRYVRLGLILLAVLLAMVTVYRSAWLGGPRTTVGWSLVGAALMGVGFAARSADHRRVALAVLATAVVRVFAIDTRGLSDAGKTVAFFALGLSLVAVAWLYSRFGRRIRDWL